MKFSLRHLVSAAILVGSLFLAACGGGGGGPAVSGGTGSGPTGPGSPTAGIPLTLPSGHGVAAGEITVPAGVSAEHGNVVLSCPAGGGACVVTVASDGTASFDRTGGVPAVTARRYTRDYSRDNPTAEDLLDHWNNPETLRFALGLSAVSQSDIAVRKRSLKALLDAVGRDSGNARIRLRNVRAEDVEIIGQKNGITYGQWKGGPAGTLNIEFDWRFAPHVGPETRAWTERAGKLWSHRLLDDFGTHVIPRGRKVQFYDSVEQDFVERTFEDTVLTNGLFVAVYEDGGYNAGGGWFEAERTESDVEPWLGWLILGKQYFDSQKLYVNRHFMHVLTHEIGHILPLLYGYGTIPSIERYVNRQDATFGGPRSRLANDGKPVPFQWIVEKGVNRYPVPPHTPGATLDWGHPAACSSIMAYCNVVKYDPQTGTSSFHVDYYEPSKMDFALLADIGYEILDSAIASEPEVYGWGAWGRYSAWGVGVERTFEIHAGDVEDIFHDRLRVSADAFGVAPATSLADNSVLSGTATWSGSLLGVDLGRPMLPPVFGDAELQVNLSNLAGVARFDGLTVYVENESAPFRAPNLEYAIEVTGNSFSDAGRYVNGLFYGPNHEEMAGVLNDQNPSVNLLAGFGGKR